MSNEYCPKESAAIRCTRMLLVIFAVICTQVLGQETLNLATTTDSKKFDDTLRQLLLKRRDVLQQRAAAVLAAFNEDRTTFESLFNAQNDLLRSELELCDSSAERIASHEKLVESRKNVEKRITELNKTGRRGGENEKYLAAVAARLEAEIGLQRERINIKTQC